MMGFNKMLALMNRGTDSPNEMTWTEMIVTGMAMFVFLGGCFVIGAFLFD